MPKLTSAKTGLIAAATALTATLASPAIASADVVDDMLAKMPSTAPQEAVELKKPAEIKAELDEKGIPYGDVELGIMIETPAAVIISEQLAKEVDFFSIGTNDLTQYTLAIDRQNAKLDNIYDSHHPAVLEMIRMTVENGHKGGCWVGICGELGADTTLTEDFLKMGVDELSVTPGSVLPIREIIRNTSVK